MTTKQSKTTKKHFVYEILNLKNGKRYIGESGDIKKRWYNHINMSRARSYLVHNAIRKHKVKNFAFRIIEEYQSESDALLGEKYWIAHYKTNVCRYGPKAGYNLTDGGEGVSGWKHSAKNKKKWSKQRRGKNNAFFGKKHSAASRKAMSQTKKRNYKNDKDYMSNMRGSKKSNAVLNEKKVLKIKKMILAGIPIKQIANAMGVKSKLIEHVRRGYAWAWLTGFTKPKKGLYRGSKVTVSKLTEDQVATIKQLILEGSLGSSEIGRRYSVSPSNIDQIKKGYTWKHVPWPKKKKR